MEILQSSQNYVNGKRHNASLACGNE